MGGYFPVGPRGLRDLVDVAQYDDTADGKALVFNAATKRWEPETAGVQSDDTYAQVTVSWPGGGTGGTTDWIDFATVTWGTIPAPSWVRLKPGDSRFLDAEPGSLIVVRVNLSYAAVATGNILSAGLTQHFTLPLVSSRAVLGVGDINAPPLTDLWVGGGPRWLGVLAGHSNAAAKNVTAHVRLTRLKAGTPF